MDNKEIMSKGPWQEDSMWTPDLQDSEIAHNEFEQLCEDDLEPSDGDFSDSDYED